MKNLFLTTAVILAVVLNSVVLTSCSKDKDVDVEDQSKKLPANEVAVDTTTGTFILDGKKISLAKFLNGSSTKSGSIDTTSTTKYFYTMYLYVKPNTKDTLIEFISIRFDQGSFHPIDIYEFPDTTFKAIYNSSPMNSNIKQSLWTGYDYTMNIDKNVLNLKYLYGDLDLRYNMKVISIDKTGKYFKTVINNDTIIFYQRFPVKDGLFVGETYESLDNIRKNCKTVLNHLLPISRLSGTKYNVGFPI